MMFIVNFFYRSYSNKIFFQVFVFDSLFRQNWVFGVGLVELENLVLVLLGVSYVFMNKLFVVFQVFVCLFEE